MYGALSITYWSPQENFKNINTSVWPQPEDDGKASSKGGQGGDLGYDYCFSYEKASSISCRQIFQVPASFGLLDHAS